MGDAGRQHRYRLPLFVLKIAHGAGAALGHVADDHRGKRRIFRIRNQIELNKPAHRVHDLELLARDLHPLLFIGAENPQPVDPLQQLRHPDFGQVVRQRQNLPRRPVVIADQQMAVDHEDSLLDRVENRLEKSAFLHEPQNIRLPAAGVDIVEPGAEAIQKIFRYRHLQSSLFGAILL